MRRSVRRPQRAVAVEIGRRQRLLEPVHAERLERAGALHRGRDVPARLGVARHAPALVGVDHQLEVGTDGVAHRGDDVDVSPPVGVVEADLARADAGIAQGDAAARALVGTDQLAARGVRVDPLVASAEQHVHGLAERPADEVPDRDLERPGAAAVEVDGLADVAHDLDAAGVDALEVTLELGAIGQVIAARVALEPLLGAHDHERRVQLAAGLGIPGRAERRVERDRVAPRLDRRDAEISHRSRTRFSRCRGSTACGRAGPRASRRRRRR